MKGFSQVITATLVLAVSIAVAGIYAEWAPSFAKDTTNKIAEQEDRKMKCRNAEFSILSAEYDLSGNLTDIELLNSGTIDFNDDLTATTLNNSRIVNQTSIGKLEVDEKREISVESDETPETSVVISEDCPGLEEDQEVTTRQ